MSTLEALARALSPTDEALAERVRLASDQPADYVAQYRRELRMRGIDRPVDTLPTVALIDGLIAAQAAVELDWREDPEAALEQIVELRVLPGGHPIPGALQDLEVELDQALSYLLVMIDQALEPLGVTLRIIQLGSDSYPLVCLEMTRVDALTDLAIAAGTLLQAPAIEDEP